MQTLPVIFVPPNLQELVSSSQLSTIAIAAFTPRRATASGQHARPVSETALTNHWVVYLISPANVVTVNPRPSGSGASTLQLVCSLENATSEKHETPAEVFRYSLPVKEGLYVRDVLEAIEKGRYQRYRFHESGHGGRYWVWCLLGFFKEIGFIIEGNLTLNGARIRLQQVWTSGGQLAAEDQQTHMVRGEFC